MQSRFIALLLVLVMCWSGFNTRGLADSIAVVAAEQVDAASPVESGTAPTGGLANDRPLDEMPASGLAETLADLQTLLMDRSHAPESGLVMARPRPYAALTRLAPYLDAPQRPPCATPFVA